MRRVARFLAAIACFAVAAVPPALAQAPEGDAQGIPAYAVARLKVLFGSVWVRTEANGEWEEFETNSPIPPGSRISVPASAEGELQFHGGQFVLLTAGTDLEVREFREERSVFRIRAGEIRFDLTQDDFAPVTVRVPGGARVHVPRPGKYWVVVDEGNRTRLVVRSGEATVVKDEGKYHVRGGEQAAIGEGVRISRFGDPEPQAAPPPEESGEIQVPPSVTSELRDYGEWVIVPEYGHVWRPYVATGWTPYVYGRWVWISPYGWTWVSYEPWGWYPYRCGYWVTIPAFGWVWYPYNAFVSVSIGVGTPWRPYYGYGGYRYYYRNAYYYPANVRFVPEGRQVRWVPLNPGERYRPAGVRRGDASLARWNRPLESNRVYVRSGADGRQTRDYTVVRTEQQVRTRQTAEQRTRKDTRPVRPEKTKEGRAPGYRTSPPAADGQGKKPSGGTYIPRGTVPEKGRPDREGKPTGSAPGTPPATGKPPAAVAPPATGKPQGDSRGRVPAEKAPKDLTPRVRESVEQPPAQPSPKVRESAPPPAPRRETPAVVPDAPEGVRGGDGGSRGGDGGGSRGGDSGGSRGGDSGGSRGGSDGGGSRGAGSSGGGGRTR